MRGKREARLPTISGTAGAEDWIEIADVQLEIGDRPSVVERRNSTMELQLATPPLHAARSSNVAISAWMRQPARGRRWTARSLSPVLVRM